MGEVFVAFMIFCAAAIGCGTYLIVFLTNRIFGRTRRATEAELQRMREVIDSQAQLIQQLQERVETLEAVIASSEYQAAQRVAKALEANPSIPAFRPAESERNIIPSVKETY